MSHHDLGFCCRGAIVERGGIFRTLTTNDWPAVYRTRDHGAMNHGAMNRENLSQIPQPCKVKLLTYITRDPRSINVATEKSRVSMDQGSALLKAIRAIFRVGAALIPV